MFSKIYVEITNICNLDCSFCHKTKRAKKYMSLDEYKLIIEKIKCHTKAVTLHLMGEPTLHPKLFEMLRIAKENGLKSVLTTNGTTLARAESEILFGQPSRVNISLHSFEANKRGVLEGYINDCIGFCKIASQAKIVCVLRLWNENGEDKLNEMILSMLKEAFPDYTDTPKGLKLCDYVFLEYGEKFDWPDMESEVYDGESYCLGLKDQIGILCDGSVVPCCLDSEGNITLGNIFESELMDIVNTERALNIKKGFSEHKACEELCRRCGYRTRFTR